MACSVSSCSRGDTGSKPRSRINSWVRDLSGPCRHQITWLIDPRIDPSEEEPSVACSHLNTTSFCPQTRNPELWFWQEQPSSGHYHWSLLTMFLEKVQKNRASLGAQDHRGSTHSAPPIWCQVLCRTFL